MLKNLKHKLIKFFIPNQIVYSTYCDPGLLIKKTDLAGKKYITIAITNRNKRGQTNDATIHHVPVEKVTGIQKSTTPFVKWFCARYNKPLPVYPILKLEK